MKLSEAQIVAIQKAVSNGGLVSSFEIAGITGNSLVQRGFMNREWKSEDYGQTTYYRLTDTGWQWWQAHTDRDAHQDRRDQWNQGAR